jgi:hypothetical protein
MPFNRTKTGVAAGLLVLLLAATSFGQGPLGMQLFAPADVSTFGGAPRPNEGYFFSFDGLYWSIQKPNVAPIGSPIPRSVDGSVTNVISFGGNYILPTRANGGIGFYDQTSSQDTSPLVNNFQTGERYEFGRVEDNHGWMVTIFRMRVDETDFTGHRAGVSLADPNDLLFGRIGEALLTVPPRPAPGATDTTIVVDGYLPVVFDSIQVSNTTDMWGVEASYLRRMMTFHNGGNLEWYLGARYFEFNENFGVIATGGTLDGTNWMTCALNHIVGPQIGAHYFKQQGRWMFSTEGRFLAGYNTQNLSQQGTFYTGTPGDVGQPLAWSGNSFSSSSVLHEFTPLVELRVEARYLITRTISFRAGWTGVWMDGIARPQGMVKYEVPNMGIDASNNRQNLLLTGLHLGIDFNR